MTVADGFTYHPLGFIFLFQRGVFLKHIPCVSPFNLEHKEKN